MYFDVPGIQGLSATGLFAVDSETGAVVWSGFGNQNFAVSSKIVVSVVVDHGAVETEGLDARSGGVVWTAAPTGTTPAIVNGVVLTTVGSAAGARPDHRWRRRDVHSDGRQPHGSRDRRQRAHLRRFPHASPRRAALRELTVRRGPKLTPTF